MKSFKIHSKKHGTHTVLVDDEDFELVSQYYWHVAPHRRTHTVSRSIYLEPGKMRSETLHRFLLKPPPELEVDHINRDGLDNRRENLRLVTTLQNSQNRRVQTRNTSGYRGVSFRPELGKWRARVRVNYKLYHLGHFDTPEEAGRIAREARERLMPFTMEDV